MPVLCLLPSFLMLPFQWLFLHLLLDTSTQESTDLKSNVETWDHYLSYLHPSQDICLERWWLWLTHEVFFQGKDSELMISGGLGSGLLELASIGLWSLVCTPLSHSMSSDVGSLTLAMVGVFRQWKLADLTHEGWFFWRARLLADH